MSNDTIRHLGLSLRSVSRSPVMGLGKCAWSIVLTVDWLRGSAREFALNAGNAINASDGWCHVAKQH